jgi:hypothetical protein
MKRVFFSSQEIPRHFVPRNDKKDVTRNNSKEVPRNDRTGKRGLEMTEKAVTLNEVRGLFCYPNFQIECGSCP